METRVTCVDLRRANPSVLLECTQVQGVLGMKFTAELPYDSYCKLLRCTCCKSNAELMSKTNLDFEIASPNSLVIHDSVDGCFTPSSILPSRCKAWVIKEFPHDMDGVWLTICPTGAHETFEYSISHDEYLRLKAMAGIAPDVPLTKGITVKSIGVVGIGDVSHLFVTIDEERKVHFQNCISVKNYDVSAHLAE